jgi:hypothetical protein
MSGPYDTTRLSEGSRHNGQYRSLRPLAQNQNDTIDDCPKPLECLPAAIGVPQHFAFVDLGDKPPPTDVTR